MRIAIDIDGVLAEFNPAFGRLLIDTSGRNLLPYDFATDPDWPSTWHWDDQHGYSAFERERAWRLIKKTDFLKRLPALPGVDLALMMLNCISTREDIYFITQRNAHAAKQLSEEWLYEHGMDNPTVICCENKIPVFKELAITHILDDRLSTCNDACFLTTPRNNVYLKDAPYNQKGRHMNLRVVTSIEDFLKKVGLWETSLASLTP